jgi:hypothetical protein
MRAALTAEVRRQRAVVSGAQIRDWIEWAFRQPTRESPQNLDDLEPSISIEDNDLDAVSGEISRVEDPDDVPTIDAVKPPAKIVIARDMLPLSAIPRLETARAPYRRATTPIQLVRSKTAIPSLGPVPQPLPRATPRSVTPLPITDTELAIPQPVAHEGTYKVRAPRWNPPTRWTREPARKPWPQLIVLAMLIAFAAMSIQLGWIDLDAWQSIVDRF